MYTALLFLALFSCFSLTAGRSLEAGGACVGIRREDSFDFELPRAVAVHVQDPVCDATWTIDQSTAILDGNLIHCSYPCKNVTRLGISVSYCPASVKFHVTCSIYTNELTCYCTNSTKNPVSSTILPSTDVSSSAFKTDSSLRTHYCAIAVAVTFALTLVILAFLICRTKSSVKYAPKRNSAEEQNQPGPE
ncbi:uncharacterized protein LOC127975524 [Carassius gibelio]|uniref:uncharacterized protein LOC127975524 n=1 Tax=Carassius gibelio TaxID=101364 RepID=UPI002277859B|nr:uncharacterized protein LOC127975524 [Carassius gibelio]